MIFQRYIRETKNRAGKTVFNARLRYKEPEWKKWRELLRTVDSRSEANTKLTDLEVEIEGSVRRSRTAGCNFNEILIRPRLTVHSEEERETGLTLLRRTKAVCMISRAITVPQTMEPAVETVKVPVEGWSNDDAVLKLGV